VAIKVTRGTNTQKELFEELSSSVMKGSTCRFLVYKVKRVVRVQDGLILGMTPKMLRQC